MRAVDDVLKFWFGVRGNDLDVLEDKSALWFSGGEEVDQQIRQEFAATLEAAGRGELNDWAHTPRGRLALIIVLDQFPRNIHRGAAQAFAYDAEAQRLCREGVAHGDDRKLRPVERPFFYMPLMHAEELTAQDECVALFERLVAEHEGPLKERFQHNLGFAHKHRDLIVEFGRYPYRNATLGRESTAAEVTHLASSEESFGQTKR
ncbi:MAG: DUF924 domain-containing protein [Polyangiaceae bacterium]|nr:DUF924 domain-containing protein [Polyangiaceae bacterium]MCW5789473.1 DUF924 domain-containing protein [Polyangiaceae bacterium]